VITRELRSSLARAAAAAGLDGRADPGLRPAGVPGRYAASLALASPSPRTVAGDIAAALSADDWIARAEVTGPGYVTVSVTPAALAAVAGCVTAAGPGCVVSAGLAGRTVPAPPPGDPLDAPTWEQARAALAAAVTARLAAAAGATVTGAHQPERSVATPPASSDRGPGGGGPRSEDPVAEPGARPHGEAGEVADAVAFAGADAVTFTLARAVPGHPLRVDPRAIARQVPGNPAYAVRYAHARAASGLRWAAASPAADIPGKGAAPPGPPADPGELALLDALGWLPERVATAARRGRPDEFARYLEGLARVTVGVLGSACQPGGDRLSLALAARTGLAAGLGLLGVSAPDRLLAEIRGRKDCEPCRPPGRAASWGRAARRSPAGAAGGPERA
jgi:arginyl-tRNA synthetase